MEHVDRQGLPLDPAVQALEQAYLRQVVDTVHDLPNVLYEVANESSGAAPPTGRWPHRAGCPAGHRLG